MCGTRHALLDPRCGTHPPPTALLFLKGPHNPGLTASNQDAGNQLTAPSPACRPNWMCCLQGCSCLHGQHSGMQRMACMLPLGLLRPLLLMPCMLLPCSHQALHLPKTYSTGTWHARVQCRVTDLAWLMSNWQAHALVAPQLAGGVNSHHRTPHSAIEHRDGGPGRVPDHVHAG